MYWWVLFFVLPLFHRNSLTPGLNNSKHNIKHWRLFLLVVMSFGFEYIYEKDDFLEWKTIYKHIKTNFTIWNIHGVSLSQLNL